MINNPKVMILDEPFRGLDAMTKELMWEYYSALYEENRRTNFFVTTDIDEAIFLADRLLIMSNIPCQVRAVIESRPAAPAQADRHGRERPLQRDQDAGAVDTARGSDEVVLARQQGRRRFRRRLFEAHREDVMDFLFSRPMVVVSLAILGAVASTLATLLQARNIIGEARARQLPAAGYACMGVSMLIFIVAGFRS